MPESRNSNILALIEQIEEKMDSTSTIYFETILNFIKWNTAIAVAATLWFGNYVINVTTKLSSFQWQFAIFSLIFFIGTIFCAIVIFYFISNYFNRYWILCSDWRESIRSDLSPHPSHYQQRHQIETSRSLLDHYLGIPRRAKSFDRALLAQMVMLCLGLVCFILFVASIR
jgi:hypothetical protein